MSQAALFAFGAVVFFVGGFGMVLAGLSLFRDWENTSEQAERTRESSPLSAAGIDAARP